ncbi:phage holin family protein [Priestia megaterium]|uniref:phage holin family protein n=1 Tax=Priestia megaterium TaxID=1404 RepID=UPI002FFDCEF0
MKQFLQMHSDTVFAFLMTGFTFVFGGWDKAFVAFCMFLVLDILTGMIKGASAGEFSSRRMRKGFKTKAGYLIVIIIATTLDRLMPESMPVLRTLCLWFYIFVEGTSVLENLAQMGVPIPKVIVERLAVIKGKSGDEAELDSNGHFKNDSPKK